MARFTRRRHPRRRLGDFFDRELSEAPWEETIRKWVPLLAPAIMAAATHGLLRTAHAARSLSIVQTPHRLHELAQGLGYWAARYQALPGTPSEDDASNLASDAVRKLRRVNEPGFRGQGLIFDEVRGLDEEPEFANAIGLAGPEDDLSTFISDLTETFATFYLANDTSPIAFVHTVTAPSALRLVAPYLDEADTRLAARYAWQTCAAIYTWYEVQDPGPAPEPTLAAENRDELIDKGDSRCRTAHHQVRRGVSQRVCDKSQPRVPDGRLDATERGDLTSGPHRGALPKQLNRRVNH